MATVVLYIVIKVYWNIITIYSSYNDVSINIPGTPHGWFRDQAVYFFFFSAVMVQFEFYIRHLMTGIVALNIKMRRAITAVSCQED